MVVKGFICGDCHGELEIMGYIDKYFVCKDCGLKNCIQKVKNDKRKNK